jgi:AsmA protein
MRALKIVGGIVAAVVGLAILAVLAVVWLVDPNDYRDDIERLVEQKTGRPLQIGGPLDLKLFPWLALRIENATLGNPPQFGKDPFLTVKSASVGVKLMPLLSKRLEVSRVSIDGLEAHLVSRGENDNNWKDLTESKEEQPAEAGGPAPQASIAGVEVTNALLVYRDEVEKSVLRLSGLELHTGALGSNEPVEARTEFKFDQGEPSPLAHVKLDTRVHLAADASKIEARDLTLNAQWFGAPDAENPQPARKEPLPLAVKTSGVVVDLNAETLEPATFEIEVGKLPLRLTAAGSRLFGDRVITGDITVPQLSPRDIMPSFGMEVPNTRDSNVLRKLSFKSSYQLTEKQLRLPSLFLVLDDTSVRGATAIEDLETMALSFDLDVSSIDVDRYLEPEAKEEAQAKAVSTRDGAVEKAEPVEIPVEALRELIAKGTLRIASAKITDLPFTQIRLPLDANKGLVRLGPTQAQLFGGGYSGNIVLDARPAQARLSLDEHVKAIDIGALMQASFDTNRVSGRGNANAALTATGNTDEAIFKTLAGKLDFDVKDGAFNGVDLWFELRRAWAVIKRQPLPTRASGTPRTLFKQMSGSATLDRGVMRNDDLKVDIDYLKANGKGTLDLASKAVDYELVAEIYKLPPEGAGAEMAELKAVAIPIDIKGTLDDMKVRPDLEGLLKARVRKEVDEKVQEKKEEIKKKLQDRLKGLLGE